MPAMCRSSITITDLVFASAVVALCSASSRWLRMRRCSRARANADLRRLVEPGCLRLTARLRCCSLRKLRDSARGPSMLVASEQTANTATPRSTPITGPSTGAGSRRSTSTFTATYQRSASRRQVADRMRPRNLSVASLVATRPMRGSTTPPCSTRIAPVSRIQRLPATLPGLSANGQSPIPRPACRASVVGQCCMLLRAGREFVTKCLMH